MAGFSVDTQLAAMSRRAHDILRGANLHALPSGGLVKGPEIKPTPPTAMFAQMAAAAKARSADSIGAMRGAAQPLLEALRINAVPAPTKALIQGRLAAQAAHKAAGLSHPAEGDPTGGGSGNFMTVSNPAQLSTSGGWGVVWSGPGKYEARKFNTMTPGGGSDTRWVKVG